MKNKKYFAIVLILFTSLACATLTGVGSGKSFTNGSSEPTNGNSETSTPETSNSPTQSFQPCETNKWEVVPVSSVSIPGRDRPRWVGTPTPPNGWNVLFVYYAVLNGSDLWGKVSINNGAATITTEGGFTYNTLGMMQTLWFPQDQSLPVPITMQSHDAMVGGNYVSQPLLIETDYLPPNFGAKGNVVGYTTQIGGGPEGWTNYPYYSIFKVAATQKQLTLTMPDIEIDCVQDGANQKGTIPSRTFDLGSYKSSWQQYPTSASVPNLGSSINFADIGTTTLKNVQLDSGNATVKFQFTNSNQGAETRGTLNAYIVDSNGYIHGFQGGQFDAGPAATVDGQDLTTLGGVPNDDHKMKIVFWIETRQGSTKSDSYAVFNYNR